MILKYIIFYKNTTLACLEVIANSKVNYLSFFFHIIITISFSRYCCNYFDFDCG